MVAFPGIAPPHSPPPHSPRYAKVATEKAKGLFRVARAKKHTLGWCPCAKGPKREPHQDVAGGLFFCPHFDVRLRVLLELELIDQGREPQFLGKCWELAPDIHQEHLRGPTRGQVVEVVGWKGRACYRKKGRNSCGIPRQVNALAVFT